MDLEKNKVNENEQRLKGIGKTKTLPLQTLIEKVQEPSVENLNQSKPSRFLTESLALLTSALKSPP